MDNRMPPTKDAPAAGASAETPGASSLRDFPFYEEGKVPQYHKYHSKISYLDELELIWGKRWGAQGIGRLREVAMVRPTESEVRKLYEEDSAFFVFNGTTPNLQLMQEQHLNLARTYEKLGIKVHYSSWSEEIPRSAYGPMKRSISAAAGFVINGGAIIPRKRRPIGAAARVTLANSSSDSAARSSIRFTAAACARSVRRRE